MCSSVLEGCSRHLLQPGPGIRGSGSGKVGVVRPPPDPGEADSTGSWSGEVWGSAPPDRTGARRCTSITLRPSSAAPVRTEEYEMTVSIETRPAGFAGLPDLMQAAKVSAARPTKMPTVPA